VPPLARGRDSVRTVLGRVGRGAVALLCVAGVPILVLILVNTFFGVPLSRYRPFSSDEVAYWHQTRTFSEVGFRGGYYTVDEITNPSGVTPFGPHGPGFAVLYGLFGAVLGWSRHLVVLANLIVIAGAVTVWIALTRLSVPRLLVAAVMLVTFWHMVFWAPMGMQESLHHAGAIVVAGCFASVLGPSPRRWTLVLGWIGLGLLTFIRPSWAIFLPLWAVATTRNARWHVIIGAVGASLLYGAAAMYVYNSTTAPYGRGFFFLRVASLSVPVEALVDNVRANLQRISRTDQYRSIELLQRYQYVAVLLTAILASIWAFRRQSRMAEGTLHLPIIAVALGTALAAMLMLYEFASFAEHRVLSAFLLFSAMLCLTAPGRPALVIALALMLSNAVSIRMAMTEFEGVWRDRFVWAERDLADLQQAIDQGMVVYRPNASRWCNTLLTSSYPSSLIAVPAGIGLSVLQKPEEFPAPPRSHYLLLDDEYRSAFSFPPDLDVIATLPYGTLYVNRGSGCG
jgi:hypothetical protein